MTQQNPGKRREGAAGVKALIAGASVAATIAGWAMLPSNDPQTAAVAPQAQAAPADQQTTLNAPDVPGASGMADTGSSGSPSQVPDFQAPALPTPTESLPQVQLPQGSFG